MSNLQGDPLNLQGGGIANNLQGAPAATIQPAGNPQNAPAYGMGPTLPTPQQQPQQTPQPPIAQPAQSVPLNSIFNPYIGTRASASNPGVLEYFNKQNGQGFSNPTDLFNYASGLGAGQISSFNQLHAPVQTTQQNGNFYGTTPNTTPAGSGNFAQQVAQGAGTAGLSPADLASIASGSSVLSPDELNAIRAGLGITPESINQIFAPPTQNTQDFYTQAYNSAGLLDIKQKWSDLNDQINQERTDLTTAQGNVNENPFLSEASRTGRLNRLDTQANANINNLIDQQSQLKDLYTQGLSEVEALTTKHAADFQTAQSLNASKLNFLLGLAETNATAQQQTNAAKVYRYLPNYLQAKVAGNQQQTIGNSDTGFFRWNPTTSQFDQVASAAGNFVIDPTSGGLYNTKTGQPAGSSNLADAFGSSAPQASNIPQKNNNPGAMRSASGQFQSYPTAQDGWNALTQDLTGKMTGKTSTGLTGNSTLQDLINVWAPSSDGNNPVAYAQDVAQQLGITPNTAIGTLLPRVNDLAVAIARHEGFFAGTAQQTQSAQSSLLQKYTNYTADGKAYMNLDKLPSAFATSLPTQAHTAQIPTLNQDEVSKIQAIDVSNQNLTKINNIVAKFLPANSWDRVLQGPANIGASLSQSNTDISSFNSWRTAIINNVQALAGGSGSGLRINQAEINTAMENDLPVITDTLPVAQNKIANLKSQLASWQGELLGTSNGGNQSLSVSNSPANLSDLNFTIQ